MQSKCWAATVYQLARGGQRNSLERPRSRTAPESPAALVTPRPRPQRPNPGCGPGSNCVALALVDPLRTGHGDGRDAMTLRIQNRITDRVQPPYFNTGDGLEAADASGQPGLPGWKRKAIAWLIVQDEADASSVMTRQVVP